MLVLLYLDMLLDMEQDMDPCLELDSWLLILWLSLTLLPQP